MRAQAFYWGMGAVLSCSVDFNHFRFSHRSAFIVCVLKDPNLIRGEGRATRTMGQTILQCYKKIKWSRLKPAMSSWPPTHVWHVSWVGGKPVVSQVTVVLVLVFEYHLEHPDWHTELTCHSYSSVVAVLPAPMLLTWAYLLLTLSLLCFSISK
jgi:hypothetical protein